MGDPPHGTEVFTIATADMDADGDDDVFFQRHHVNRWELFENTGGALVQRNPRGADTSGVFDNPRVPELYAVPDDVRLAAIAEGDAGLFVFHEVDRYGRWWIWNHGLDAVAVDLLGNNPYTGFSPLSGATVIQEDDFLAHATLPDGAALRVHQARVSTELLVTSLDGELPFRLGADRVPRTAREVSLWKNDPHGVAWRDVKDGPEAELCGPTLYTQAGPEVIPPDYGRGRQVGWYDLDGDGDDELYIACTATANVLLDDVDGSGHYVDRAPELGLDLVRPEAFALLDVDGDGHLDLVHSQEDVLVVTLRRAHGYVLGDAEAYGLVSPAPPATGAGGVFDLFTLHALDHDRDGDLDLWMSHFDEDDQVAVLRNDGGHFTPVTEALGLGEARGFTALLPVDVDRDGYVDIIGTHAEGSRLWRNEGGQRFVAVHDDMGFADAAVADIDGDGRLDVVGVRADGDRRLLFDRTTGGPTSCR